MKGKISIYWIPIISIVIIILAVLLFMEVNSVRDYLISNTPDSEQIRSLERMTLIWAVILLCALALAYIALQMARKPKVIEKIVTKTEEEEEDKAQKEKELKAQQEEKEQRTIETIMHSIEGSSIKAVGESFLIALAKQFEIAQGIFYYKESGTEEFSLKASYAYYSEEDSVRNFKLGHGLPGQVALNKEFLNLTNLPEKYLTIMSGLGTGSPRHLLIFPIIINAETIGVIELASFIQFSKESENIIKEAAKQLTLNSVFVG